jgi:hypothetical protein
MEVLGPKCNERSGTLTPELPLLLLLLLAEVRRELQMYSIRGVG